MKFFFLVICLSLGVSCSTTQKKEKENPPLSSPVVVTHVTTIQPKTMSAEELKRLELLDYYRRLREEAFFKKKPIKEKPQKQLGQKKDKEFKKEVKKEIHKTMTPYLDDEKIQLEQLMTYHCMKYESRFSRPEDCKEHTESVLNDCQKEKVNQASFNVVQCLKKKM